MTGDLAEIVEVALREGVTNPSMIVIGEVVRLRDELQWFAEQADSQGALQGAAQ